MTFRLLGLILVGWVAVSVVAGPLIGRWLRRRFSATESDDDALG